MKGFARTFFLSALFCLPLAHLRSLHDQTELPKRAFAALVTWSLAALWVWRTKRQKDDPLWRPTPLPFYWGCGFLLWQLAIWPFASVPSQAVDVILVTMESLIWLWLAFELLDSPTSRRVALLIIAASGVIAAMFGLVQFEEVFPDAAPGGLVRLGNYGKDVLENILPWGNPLAPLRQTDAPGSYFGHTNFAAEFVLCGFVVLLVLGLSTLCRSLREASWLRFFTALMGIGGAGVLGLFLLRTGSRAAFLGGGIAVGAAWFHLFTHDLIHRPLWGQRLWHVLLHSSLVVLVLGGSFVASQKIMVSPRSGQEQVTLWQRALSSFDSENTTIRERFDLWANTWAMTQANPVFGVGPGNFKVAYPDFSSAVRQHEVGRLSLRRQPNKPHNEFLNILAENGGVGFALAMAAFLSFLLPFVRNRNGFRRAVDEEDGVALAAICVILAFLIVACFGFPWQRTGTRIVFLVAMAVAMRLSSPSKYKFAIHRPQGWAWSVVFLLAIVASGAHYRARIRASASVADIVSGKAQNAASDPTLGVLRTADQMVRRVPWRADYQLRRAHLYRQVGLLKEAESGYLAALKRAPSLTNAWLGLAKVQLADQRPVAANRAVQRALKLQPNEPGVLVAAGEIFETLGDHNRAIGAMLKGLELAPTGPDRLQALLALTHVHSALDNHATAAHFLSEAEQLAPGHLAVLETKAYFFERHQPKSSQTMNAWARFSAAKPQHAEAHLRLAENWLQRRDYKAALAESEAAYLADNSLMIALYRRAQSQLGLGRLEEARASLLECVKKTSRPLFRDSSLFDRCLKLVGQIEARMRREGQKPNSETLK